MARFMVFVPDSFCTDPSGLARLDAVGLSRLKGGAVFEPITAGPSGGPGIFVQWPRVGESRGGYLPGQQTWRETPSIEGLPRGRFWTGFENASPPTPGDLAWRDQAPGKAVRLGDHDWLIPHATSLPMNLSEGPDGTIGQAQQQASGQFCSASQALFSRMVGRCVDATDVPAVVRLTYHALSVNYGLTVEVMSHLGLLTTRNMSDVLQVAVDGLWTATTSALAEEIEKSNMPEVPSEFLN